MQAAKYTVALLWAGDLAARRTTTLQETRLSAVDDALRQVGIALEPAVYADELVDEVRDQLLRVDGVLVWVDPADCRCGHLRQHAPRRHSQNGHQGGSLPHAADGLGL